MDARSYKRSGSGSFGILPTPSPEQSPGLSHSGPPPHELFSLQNQVPSWEVLRPDGSSGTVSAGMKRSHDFSVDEFVSDMKKRRVTPSYDPRECIFGWNVLLLNIWAKFSWGYRYGGKIKCVGLCASCSPPTESRFDEQL